MQARSSRTRAPSASQLDSEECLAAGTDDYVTKPIRVDVLVEALLGAASRGNG